MEFVIYKFDGQKIINIKHLKNIHEFVLCVCVIYMHDVTTLNYKIAVSSLPALRDNMDFELLNNVIFCFKAGHKKKIAREFFFRIAIKKPGNEKSI